MTIKNISLSVSVVFVFFSMFVLSACTTAPGRFDLATHASSSNAVVYIYRPNSLSNVMVAPDVLINGVKEFSINNNYYNVIHLPAGKHQIKLDLTERYQGVNELVLDTVSGQNYFLRVTTAVKFQMNKPYDRWFNLEQVRAKIAQDEIAQCKPYKPDSKAPADEVATQETEESEYSSQKFRNPFSK
ncbi:MAG TPA: DUF2846 domain-containing protein [Gammaproteobacteria bacterium]